MKWVLFRALLWITTPLIAALEWSKPTLPAPKPVEPPSCSCLGCDAARSTQRGLDMAQLLVLLRVDLMLGYALGASSTPMGKELDTRGRPN